MTEQIDGAWYESIRGAMLLGRQAGSRFAYDRVFEAKRRLERALTGSEARAEVMEQSLARDQENTKDSKDAQKLIVEFSSTNISLRASINKFKEALENNDGYVIHAFESRLEDINKQIDKIEESARIGAHGEYVKEMNKLVRESLNKARQWGWNEADVIQTAHEKLARYSVPEKDQVNVGLRISSAQFAQRYNLNPNELTKMFLSYGHLNREMKDVSQGILKELNQIDSEQKFNGQFIFTNKQKLYLDKEKKLIKDRIAKKGTPDPNKFWRQIAEPLILGIKMKEQILRSEAGKTMDTAGWNRFNNQLLSDISSITQAYFSSMPIKQYSWKSNENGEGSLYVSETKVGYTEKYGVQGIIAGLNNTSEVSILSNSFLIDGKSVAKPTKKQMQQIIAQLESDNGISVEFENGLRSYISDPSRIDEQKIAQGNDVLDPGKQRFKVLEADESTLVLIRIGNDKRIHKDIQTAFRKHVELKTGEILPGGHLYERLIASLDTGTDPTKSIYPEEWSRLIDDINNDTMTDADVKDAVMLTRLINDRPALIKDWFTRSDDDKKKDWKYLKLSEMKNGFVGHEENLARTRSFLEGAAKIDETGFFKNVLKLARKFLPEGTDVFPEMKILSIADEIEHNNNNISIFSSLDRKAAELTKMKDDGLIDQATYDDNIERYRELSKSIVDGETFLSKEAYVANLAMMGGISRDMIKFDKDGNLKQIMVGGLKPTISHTDVKTDRGSDNYGRVKEFYAKTAFKYNPEFDSLFDDYKIDAITFGSANKINNFRNKKGEEWYNTDNAQIENMIADGKRNVHAHINPIENIADMPMNFGSVSRFIQDNLQKEDWNVHYIPFESINLKSLGQPHDPLVGSNIGVHLHQNVGVKDWIGLDTKLENVYGAFKNHNDPYYSTKLAQDLFAHSSETGDMAWVSSGIDSFLKNDGLVTAPWMRTKIEEKIIPYFLNNGMIAGGRVNEGSLDVMTADMGGLKTSVLKINPIDNTRSVQFYGEFLQSKHSAEKTFKAFNTGLKDVGSVFIQRVDHHTFKAESPDENGNYTRESIVVEGVGEGRKADGFFIDTPAGKYLIVEGKGINSKGEMIDLLTERVIRKPNERISK